MTTTNGHVRRLTRATLDDPETAMHLERSLTATHGNVHQAAMMLDAARHAVADKPLDTDLTRDQIQALEAIAERLLQLNEAARDLKARVAIALGKAAEDVVARLAEAEKSRVPAKVEF